VYVLRDVQSQPLPAVADESGTAQAFVYADTLRITPDFRASRAGLWEWRSDGGTFGPIYSTGEYSYRISAMRVILTYDCPINALCANVEYVGTVGSEGLLITSGYDRLPLRYERVSRTP